MYQLRILPGHHQCNRQKKEEAGQWKDPEDRCRSCCGWRTVLWLNRDGTFTGEYSDSEMGEQGDDYPNGSYYVCRFSGRFEIGEQIDDHSYSLTLATLIAEQSVGTEWIEDGVRYVASGPYGLIDPMGEKECRDFVFCLPELPADQLGEDFRIWWPYFTENKTTLSCYAILNTTAGTGFFTYE